MADRGGSFYHTAGPLELAAAHRHQALLRDQPPGRVEHNPACTVAHRLFEGHNGRCASKDPPRTTEKGRAWWPECGVQLERATTGGHVTLLHPPLPLVYVSIGMKKERQQNDSLANG